MLLTFDCSLGSLFLHHLFSAAASAVFIAGCKLFGLSSTLLPIDRHQTVMAKDADLLLHGPGSGLIVALHFIRVGGIPFGLLVL